MREKTQNPVNRKRGNQDFESKRGRDQAGYDRSFF